MKKSIIAIALFVVLGALFLGYNIRTEAEAQTAGQVVERRTSHNATSTYRGGKSDADGGYFTSTSSWQLIPGNVLRAWEGALPADHRATQTMEVAIQGWSFAVLNLDWLASTSASNLSVAIETSYDRSNWYDYIPTQVFANTALTFGDA